jgi:hypothetical protein
VIKQFAEWCGRNIELIIWFNIVLLVLSAVDQLTQKNLYPMGMCVVLITVVLILRK